MNLRFHRALIVLTVFSPCVLADEPVAEKHVSLSVPEGARIRLVPLKQRWFLGENILLHYEVMNEGDRPFSIESGGDYRGGTRANRFRVMAISEAGVVQDDPVPEQLMMGGLGGSREIKPGESWFGHVPLTRYRNLERPGRYTIRVMHDLGWGGTRFGGTPFGANPPVDDDENDPRWAETTIEVVMPNDKQAHQVVADMREIKDSGWILGKKRDPYADYGCLRYAVYLPTLLELAHSHHQEAIRGIAGLASPEGTAALIELLSLPDDPKLRKKNNAVLKEQGLYTRENETIADRAARALNERVPYAKRLAGRKSAYGRRGEAYLKAREKLVSASWRPEHATPVREYAKHILLHSTPQGLRDNRKENAAGLLQAIGTAEDHAATISALDRVLTLSQRLPLESPLTYGLIVRLLECAKTLDIGPPDEPTTPGEIAVYLQAMRRPAAERPAGFQMLGPIWLNHPISYIRRLTLEALPRPLPAWAIEELAPLVKSKDVGVRLQAANLIKDSADAQFREIVLQRISSEDDRWVMGALNRAAYAVGLPRDEILETWSERLGETMYDRSSQCFSTGAKSFEILQASVIDYSGGSGWNGNQGRQGDVGLTERWLAFIAANRADLRRGRKFQVGDPELTENLFPSGAHINHKGKPWPPQRPHKTRNQDEAFE